MDQSKLSEVTKPDPSPSSRKLSTLAFLGAVLGAGGFCSGWTLIASTLLDMRLRPGSAISTGQTDAMAAILFSPAGSVVAIVVGIILDVLLEKKLNTNNKRVISIAIAAFVSGVVVGIGLFLGVTKDIKWSGQ